MINVDKVTALLFYLFFFLFLYLGTWIARHFNERKKGGVAPPYRLVACEYCAYNYLADEGKNITNCPQCNSYNLKNKT